MNHRSPRLLTAIALAAVALTTAATPAWAKPTTLDSRPGDSSSACAPAYNPAGWPWWCDARAGAWNDPRAQLYVDLVSGVAQLMGVEPSATDVTATGSAAAQATHILPRSVPSVRYTWRFASLTRSGSFNAYTPVGSHSALVRAAVELSALHAGCSACRASVRRVLMGSDERTSEYWSYSSWDPVELEVEMRNPAGRVPAGRVDLQATLDGVAALYATPTFSGQGRIRVHLSTTDVTAS